MLEAFEKILGAQKSVQAGLNELASGTRAVARATDTLADAWDRVARAAQRAAEAGARAARASAGQTAAPTSGGSSGGPSGGALVPAPLLLPAPSSGGALVPAPLLLPAPSSGGRLVPLPPSGATGSGAGAGGAGMSPGGGLLGGPPGLPPLNVPPPGGGEGVPNYGFPGMGRAITAIWIVDRLVNGIARLTEKAAGFNDALVALEQRGVTPAARTEIGLLAYDVANQVPGRTYEQIVRDAGSLRAVLGESAGPDSMAAVKAFLPDVEKTAAALAGGSHISSEAAMHMLFRAIEMRGGTIDPKTGKISPERFRTELEAAYKVLQTAGNIVSERDILNLLQQGSLMSKTMENPDDFWKMMLAPLIDMKGSRAGTALQAAGRQLLGGIMTKRTATEMERIGILPEGSFSTHGAGYVEVKPEVLANILEAMKGGLNNYIEKIVRPALVSHGYVTPEQQNAEVMKIAGTDTFRRLMSLFLSNAEQVLKEGQLYDKVPPINDALKLLNKESIGYNMNAMFASVTNFLQSVEKANAGTIIGVLHAAQAVFDWLSNTQGIREKLEGHEKEANEKFGSFYHYWPWEKGFWVGGNPLPGAADSRFGFPRWDPHPRPDADRSYSDPTPTRDIERHGAVYLDGKKVGEIVMGHMADELSRPNTGSLSPSVSAVPLMPGYSPIQ